MNTKHTPHTPGPWHAGGRGDRIIYAADGYAVASATVFHNQHDGQLEANARLIAAAPELLAELSKRVGNAEEAVFDRWLQDTAPSGDVNSVKRQWEESRDYQAFNEQWRSAFDVIAKATGA
jgi:RES domain-containing protein